MKVAFITRSTLYKVPGGDTEQITQTAECLKDLGIEADIYLTNEPINYDEYDLLHFSNIIRPADILYHTQKTQKPFVLSPNLVDYSEYDKLHRRGIAGFVFRLLPEGMAEYLKSVARWLLGQDVLKSKSYLAKGHGRSVRDILRRTSVVLPASRSEEQRLKKLYALDRPCVIVPNGIDTNTFLPNEAAKNDQLVICAARIEGVKNQYNLIKALNNSPYTLMIIGDAAPNQKKYYRKCKQIAAANVIFTGRLAHDELVRIYRKAKVHVLPSWFETCGLATLEAAAMGCNVVITDKGYTRDYFGDEAFYCDPSDPRSIRNAVEAASNRSVEKKLQARILENYTWQRAAVKTYEAYKQIIAV